MATKLNYRRLPLGILLQLIDGEITEEQAEAYLKRHSHAT